MPSSQDTREISEALGGRFLIEAEPLRVGGQGVVYKARRFRDAAGQAVDDEVALKLCHDPTQVERFQRETSALKGFRHPNLAYLIEDGTILMGSENVLYVAWEFVQGYPLDHKITQGPMQPSVVAAIGRDVSRAISYIWERRIVHRDVNPKNIMLRPSEVEAVLIDLGIAKHLDMSTLTGPGIAWGTLGYFSPEQWRGENHLTCHSDVYSLAVSLQEALMGRHPTNRDQRTLYSRTPRTSSLDPSIPAGLAEVLDEMLKSRAPFRPHPVTLAERFSELAARL